MFQKKALEPALVPFLGMGLGGAIGGSMQGAENLAARGKVLPGSVARTTAGSGVGVGTALGTFLGSRALGKNFGMDNSSATLLGLPLGLGAGYAANILTQRGLGKLAPETFYDDAYHDENELREELNELLKQKPTHDKVKKANLNDRPTLDNFDANPLQNPFVAKSIPKLNDPNNVRNSPLPQGAPKRMEDAYPPPKKLDESLPVSEDAPVVTPGIYDNIRNYLSGIGINLPGSFEEAGTQIGDFFRNASNRVSDFFGTKSGSVKIASVAAEVVGYIYMDKLAQDTKLPKTFLEKLANALQADPVVFVKSAYARPELFFSVVRYFGAPKQTVKTAGGKSDVAKGLWNTLFGTKGRAQVTGASATGLGALGIAGYSALPSTPKVKEKTLTLPFSDLNSVASKGIDAGTLSIPAGTAKPGQPGLGASNGGLYRDELPGGFSDPKVQANASLSSEAQKSQRASIEKAIGDKTYFTSKKPGAVSLDAKPDPANPELAGASKPGDYGNEGFSYKNWWQGNKDWAGPVALGAGGLTAGLGAYQLYKYLTRNKDEEEML